MIVHCILYRFIIPGLDDVTVIHINSKVPCLVHNIVIPSSPLNICATVICLRFIKPCKSAITILHRRKIYCCLFHCCSTGGWYSYSTTRVILILRVRFVTVQARVSIRINIIFIPLSCVIIAIKLTFGGIHIESKLLGSVSYVDIMSDGIWVSGSIWIILQVGYCIFDASLTVDQLS